MTNESKKEMKPSERIEALDRKNFPTQPVQIIDAVGEKNKPEKKGHPIAGIETFNIIDQDVCSHSNAEYIYLLLDKKDKSLLMMMMLPHIRKTLMAGSVLNPEAVADLIEWHKEKVALAVHRIKRLCFFGAIVTKKNIGWVANPKLASIISLNK